MASQEDLAALQHFYDELARGNFWVGKEVFDPEIEFEWDDSSLEGKKTYHGLREVEATTKDWLTSWEWFRVELEELIDAGNKVVALTRSLGRPRGATSDVIAMNAEVWTMKDGKAIARRAYNDRSEALNAARAEA